MRPATASLLGHVRRTLPTNATTATTPYLSPAVTPANYQPAHHDRVGHAGRNRVVIVRVWQVCWLAADTGRRGAYRGLMASDKAREWVSPACTLPTTEQPTRVAEFEELFSRARWLRRADRNRLDIALPPDAEPTGRDLAERESRCCSFFTFAFEPIGTDVVMHVGVPADHIAVLDALQAKLLR